MPEKYAYLQLTSSDGNHNKYYQMTENKDGSIDVVYGRVGVSANEVHYNYGRKSFEALKREKIAKGYQDLTSLHSERSLTQDSVMMDELRYQKSDDEVVSDFVEEIIRTSREFMKQNYQITIQEVTQKMIDEAEHDIGKLESIANSSSLGNIKLYHFNQVLNSLFMDIPRKMKQVEDCMAKSEADIPKILQREREMLDSIQANFSTYQSMTMIRESESEKEKTWMEANGLTIRTASYQEEDQIIAHLGRDYKGESMERRFVRAFAVRNEPLEERYQDFRKEHHMTPKEIRYFYHGTRTENVRSLLKMGMLLNPDAVATGKMFGQGLYFASNARKSANYMDTAGSIWNHGKRENGYMLIYSVAVGNYYMPHGALGHNFRGKDLPHGYDSVYANRRLTGLKNDEWIVYDEAQCAVRYVLEMRSNHARELSFHLNRSALRNQLQDGFTPLQETENGFRTQLLLDKIPKVAKEELDKFFSHFHPKEIYFDYHSSTDTLSFCILNQNDEMVRVTPELTGDDMHFLCREMKKEFAESEYHWKKLVENSGTEQEKNKKEQTIDFDEIEL